MKKCFLFVLVLYLYPVYGQMDYYEKVAKEILKNESFKIQYVFEGEIIKIEIYGGDTSGKHFTASDMIWDINRQCSTYRMRNDGPVAYSIATIKIDRLYKGIGIKDTIKIITTDKSGWFDIRIIDKDTQVNYSRVLPECVLPSFNNIFFEQGRVGDKAVFFAYDQHFSFVGTQVKTISSIGFISMHLPNRSANEGYNLVFAHNSGPLAHIGKPNYFFSREEMNCFLRRLPIRKLEFTSTALSEETRNRRKNKRKFKMKYGQ